MEKETAIEKSQTKEDEKPSYIYVKLPHPQKFRGCSNIIIMQENKNTLWTFTIRIARNYKKSKLKLSPREGINQDSKGSDKSSRTNTNDVMNCKITNFL